MPEDEFLEVAEALCANSGRERTSAICYAVGWTQHTVGVQIHPRRGDHPAAAGQHRPARRRHPGAARPRLDPGLDRHPDALQHPPRLHPDAARPRARQPRAVPRAEHRARPASGAHMDAYIDQPAEGVVGRRRDRRERLLLRLPAAHHRRPLDYQTVLGDARRRGARATSCSARTRPSGRPTRACTAGRWPKLDWLVVRDLSRPRRADVLARRARGRDRRAPHRRTSGPRCSSCPPPRTPRRTAASPTPSGCCSGTTRRSSRRATAAPSSGSRTTSGRIIREKLAARPTRRTGRCCDLTWDYPTSRARTTSPSAEAVLREINGWRPGRPALSAYTELKDDGSTACGCWIYCGCYADGTNQTARRKPGSEQRWVAPEWGWAWPANRRILYNRASADPDGRPWSERKRYVWWDEETGDVDRARTCPTSVPTSARTTSRPTERGAEDAIAGDDAVHHAGGRPGLAVRTRLASSTARCRRTTSRTSRRSRTRSTRSSRTRRASGSTAPGNR